MVLMRHDAQGKPFIDWYMPWMLLLTMFMLVGMACILLMVEVFTGVSRKVTMAGFKERMYMVTTEVPDYIQHAKRCREAYRERMN